LLLEAKAKISIFFRRPLQENLPFLKVEPSFPPRTCEKKVGLDKLLDHQLKASLQESTSVIITVLINFTIFLNHTLISFFVGVNLS